MRWKLAKLAIMQGLEMLAYVLVRSREPLVQT
ncbi:hypothetical protein T190_12100 [Sinorhizobium meliloti CCBAU 01290]|nr:hypothetical protein T190_12100 [Sinorhizobium meliloti CCBAU 01290]